MPRLSSTFPAYRRHKASGQAVVTLCGQDIYLGSHGTATSKREYDRVIGEWLAAGRQLPTDPGACGSLQIVSLVLRYWRFAESHYQSAEGRATKELDNIRYTLRPLKRIYGHTKVGDFGPLALKAIQNEMIQSGLCRSVINLRVGRIKRMFKWAVSEQLCPASVLHAIQSVSGLQRGRTEARESLPVLPVTGTAVDTTLPHLPAVVADMVRFQRLTGCRPGEVCSLRPRDVDRTGDIWVYRPASHKMAYRGRERLIFIGPKAQAILEPYLERDSSHCCFSPADSERLRKQEMRERRQSKVQPSQLDRSTKEPKTQPGGRYWKDSYSRAILRACKKAFPVPEGLVGEAVRQWHKEHRWSPNQLRHAAATEIRRRYGLEAAQVILGHSRADVTQVYAERDQGLAARIAGEIG